MEVKCVNWGWIVVFLLLASVTAAGDTEPELDPAEIAHQAAAVAPPRAQPQSDPRGKRIIYINQCNAADANLAIKKPSEPVTHHGGGEGQHRSSHAAQKEIEFSTDTTIYRLRVIDGPFTCANGARPKMYQSKEEETESNLNEDDYYYYDDDKELAALVNDGSQFSKLIQQEHSASTTSKPQTQDPGAPAAAANSIPTPDFPDPKEKHDLYILADGKLQIDRVYYDIQDYCIASFKGASVKVLACNRICAPPEIPCVRKCCALGSTFDIGVGSCTKSNATAEWSPLFYRDPSTVGNVSNTATPVYQIRMPSDCVHGYDIWPFEFGKNLELRGLQEYTKLHLLPDGSVQYLTRSRKWHSLTSGDDDFCIESGELIPNLTQNQMIIKCSHASYSQEIGIITLLIAVLYSIGSLFLTAITVLFILLWDDTSNVHTWAIFIEIVILLLHYITLTSIYYLILNVKTAFWILGTSACVALGVVSHFTYISIFSWMAILNYDFWITFSTKNTNGDPKAVATSKLRFFVYFLLGFGVPGLVITLGLLMDHFYADPESGVLVPEYGQYFACSMSRWAQGAYIYFPIGLLYIISLVYMIKTHYLINETRSTSNKVLWKSAAEQEKAGPACRIRLSKYWWQRLCYRYSMLFNVSIICGLTWIVQIISFIVFQFKSNAGDTTISAAGTSLIYVSISDLVVGIQPIGICIIFLIQDRIWKQLIRKYGFCRRLDRQLSQWTDGAGVISKPVAARKQGYNLTAAIRARAADGGATQEEMVSMVNCCKESVPTVDSVIPSMDYLDGKQKQTKESPSSSIESISYKWLPDVDRETVV